MRRYKISSLCTIASANREWGGVEKRTLSGGGKKDTQYGSILQNQ